MRIRLLAVTLAILASPLVAAIIPKPANLGFEEGTSGWKMQSAPGYQFAIVPEAHSGAAALKIWSTAEKPEQFLPATQSVDATPYRGKLVRVRGWVRAEVTDAARAQLAMRVDRPDNKPGFFDNMMNRPIRNRSWQSYDIVGEVAPDATALVFGAVLGGSGAMWVDDFSVTDLAALPPPSKKAQQYLEKAIGIMEKRSIRRDKVDWPALRSRALLMVRGANEPAETYEAIRYAIGQLGDHHSFFLGADAGKEWKGAGGSNPRPEIKLTEEEVGYISVPSYGGGDQKAIAAYIDDVQGRIAAVDPRARCGWLVDLRNNGGGNMWPMLSGLGPLIGEGELLSLVSPDDRSVVVYRKGLAVGSDAAEGAAAKKDAYVPQRAPAIAVLTSPKTASSGEAVTIALRGRPHTRSFGAATAGASTGNENFPLDDGAILFLTTTVMADRTGAGYGQAVKPDVEITGDAETTAAATKWVREESGCGEAKAP